METNENIVLLDEPTTVELKPTDFAIVISVEGKSTHYVPNGEEAFTPGHAYGAAESIAILSTIVAQMLKKSAEG